MKIARVTNSKFSDLLASLEYSKVPLTNPADTLNLRYKSFVLKVYNSILSYIDLVAYYISTKSAERLSPLGSIYIVVVVVEFRVINEIDIDEEVT